MRTELYWVPTPGPGRLALAPRPRGGDWLSDELRAWRAAGVDVAVSLLTPDEAAELGLAGEPAAARAHGIEFVSFPTPDRGIPADGIADLIDRIGGHLADGRAVAVHCRQGIGRAGMVAAAVLIASGLDPDAAVRQVTAARGRPVPETLEQLEWVRGLAPTPAVR